MCSECYICHFKINLIKLGCLPSENGEPIIFQNFQFYVSDNQNKLISGSRDVIVHAPFAAAAADDDDHDGNCNVYGNSVYENNTMATGKAGGIEYQYTVEPFYVCVI